MNDIKNMLMSKPALWAVFGLTLLLAVITITVGRYDFTRCEQVLAPLPVNGAAFKVFFLLILAGLQAALTGAFFMGMLKESFMNRLVFLTGVLFMLVFIMLTLSDTLFRGIANPVEAERVQAIK